MPVRTKRLAQGSSAPVGTTQVIYTAPAGETVIVKDIHLDGEAAASTRAAVQVSSGSGWQSLTDGPLQALGVRSLQIWVVLQPGDQLRVYSEGSFFLYWVSGTELEGVAD